MSATKSRGLTMRTHTMIDARSLLSCAERSESQAQMLRKLQLCEGKLSLATGSHHEICETGFSQCSVYTKRN